MTFYVIAVRGLLEGDVLVPRLTICYLVSCNENRGRGKLIHLLYLDIHFNRSDRLPRDL